MFLDVFEAYKTEHFVSPGKGLLLCTPPPPFRRVKVYTQHDGKVSIHPKSVNAEEREFNYKWLIYHLKMRTSSVSRRGSPLGPAFKGRPGPPRRLHAQ